MAIINRHRTRKPKSTAAQELKAIALTLKDSSEAAFTATLQAWEDKHKSFLHARSVHPVTGKTFYTHKRLRSAYNSLKKHLPYLFTFERHPDPNIPTTINLLEGEFGKLKRLLACHQGMEWDNKFRFVKDYFANSRGGRQ